MNKKIVLWSILAATLLLLTVGFGGSVQTSPKLVKVGGTMNHCDCTYRIE